MVSLEKKIGKEIHAEEHDITKILSMIWRRNFTGYTGVVVKNSVYQIGTTVIAKIAALVFTIILARLLLPELFGLYGLTLSTILIFLSFADLGVEETLVRFLSRSLGIRNVGKARAYLSHLLRIKFWLILGTVIVFVGIAPFIANTFYNKPILLALYAGVLYIVTVSFVNFLEALFQSLNNFTYPFYKELVFQISRLILVPTAIIIALRSSVSHSVLLFSIFLALATAYGITLLFYLFLLTKETTLSRVRTKTKLARKEKEYINSFILPLSVISLSALFFGHIDMLMLGRYVDAAFIGNYKAAFSLVAAAVPLIAFANVLFPVFSRLRGTRLERALGKSIRITVLLSIIAVVMVFSFAPLIVHLIFGSEYEHAILLLRILSLLFISLPLTSIFTTYMVAQGKTKTVAVLLIIATLTNIALNYFLIKWFISYSPLAAVVGVAIATIVSRYGYLSALIIVRWYDTVLKSHTQY